MSRIASPISRRRVLRAAGVAALTAPAIITRVLAESLSPLGPIRPDQLPDPNFALLSPTNPFRVGVRPHRKTGVRLELVGSPLSTPSGTKYLIHNYGHSGAGITLSWGCASIVVDHVATVIHDMRGTRLAPSVAVLGTGVIGLTVATELRRKWPKLPITVYAKDLNVQNTTSHIAGGQFEPSFIVKEYENAHDTETLVGYLKRANDRIEEIATSSTRQRIAFGIAQRFNYTLDQGSPGLNFCVANTVLDPFKTGTLPFAHLKSEGRQFDTWLIDPTILLPKLVADLHRNRVRFVQRVFDRTHNPITNVAESIIVNCTGYAAKDLVDDDQPMIARRGHLVALQKTMLRQWYFLSGGCANDDQIIMYVFCRANDIVVGGTQQDGNDSTTVGPDDMPIFKRIIENAAAVFGGDVSHCVMPNPNVA